MAPDIAVPVPVTESTTEDAVKVIAAKTITCANITYSHWRRLRGAARLHGSLETLREPRARLRRSVQPIEL